MNSLSDNDSGEFISTNIINDKENEIIENALDELLNDFNMDDLLDDDSDDDDDVKHKNNNVMVELLVKNMIYKYHFGS